MNDSNTAYATNIQEAVERTQEAEALAYEAAVRKFRGDKVAADQYLERKLGTRGAQKAAELREKATVATKRVWGS